MRRWLSKGSSTAVSAIARRASFDRSWPSQSLTIGGFARRNLHYSAAMVSKAFLIGVRRIRRLLNFSFGFQLSPPRVLSLAALLLVSSVDCAAYQPAVRPCAEEQLVGSWAGLTNDNRIAVLFTLEKDRTGRIEIWFRDERGEPEFISRRIENFEYSGDGNFRARGEVEQGKGARSVGIAKAHAECGELWSAIQAAVWLQGIAYAELSLEPLSVFRRKNRHLEIFFGSPSAMKAK